MELAAIIAVVVVALVFDYTNGFHDAANAIATSISTRALTPRIALGVAAIGNLIGSWLNCNPVCELVFVDLCNQVHPVLHVNTKRLRVVLR